jgi:hypothetical protein
MSAYTLTFACLLADFLGAKGAPTTFAGHFAAK